MEYAYCLWKYRKDRVCLYPFFFKLQIHVRKKNFLLTSFPRISYLALYRDLYDAMYVFQITGRKIITKKIMSS